MSGLTGEQASRSSPRKLPEVGLSPKYQSVANRAWRSSNRMRGARAVDSILGDYVLSVETRWLLRGSSPPCLSCACAILPAYASRIAFMELSNEVSQNGQVLAKKCGP